MMSSDNPFFDFQLIYLKEYLDDDHFANTWINIKNICFIRMAARYTEIGLVSGKTLKVKDDSNLLKSLIKFSNLEVRA